MDRVETTILRNLVHDEDYLRKVVPFIEPDYFSDRSDRLVFESIAEFVVKYDKPATQEILSIELENNTNVTEEEYKQIKQFISDLSPAPVNIEWLMETTEKWCRDKAIYLALMESIKIADGQHEKKGRDAIPSILSDALVIRLFRQSHWT